mmetsp:Transcript_40913/g.100960  ORF Transcript_40913/g.100960 Transcript_40913/m.100960 type:complete len:202 (-) Transcript_40913:419-1024(-)
MRGGERRGRARREHGRVDARRGGRLARRVAARGGVAALAARGGGRETEAVGGVRDGTLGGSSGGGGGVDAVRTRRKRLHGAHGAGTRGALRARRNGHAQACESEDVQRRHPARHLQIRRRGCGRGRLQRRLCHRRQRRAEGPPQVPVLGAQRRRGECARREPSCLHGGAHCGSGEGRRLRVRATGHHHAARPCAEASTHEW